MSTAPEPIRPPIHPRPGVLKTLGILNLVFSILTLLCLASSMGWVLMASMAQSPNAAVKVEIKAAVAPGSKPMVAFNPFMGMDDPGFVRFCLVDAFTGTILNLLMFATGIGLINLRRWGAKWWTVVAWTKIARLILVWSVFILFVAFSLSENMARNVAIMLQQQAPGRGGLPSVADLTRIYSIANLIGAVLAMVVGSIYPIISLWVLNRPGVKAAIVDKPATEPEFP